MKETNVLLGFFSVPGVGIDSVETPIVGNPRTEHEALKVLIRKRHPNAPKNSIVCTGTVLERRGGDDLGYVEMSPVLILGQLFGDKLERRKIGRTFISGAPYDIILTFHRAQGTISVLLKALLKNDGDMRLPDRLNPQTLADGLPTLIKEILGAGARDTKLDIREAAAPKKAV